MYVYWEGKYRTKQEIRNYFERERVLDSLKIEDSYKGGVVFWVHDGEDLLTMYIVDCTPCKLTHSGNIELILFLTDLELTEASYDGPETLGTILTGYKLRTPEHVMQLVKESKPFAYHVTNVEWSFRYSWAFLRYIETANMHFRDFKKEEFLVMLQKATDITIMYDLLLSGDLKFEDLEAYMEEYKISNDMWYVVVNLKTFWSDSLLEYRIHV